MAIHYGKLTPARIAKITKDGMRATAAGYTCKQRGRGKSWVFRWKDRRTGQPRVMGLGSCGRTNAVSRSTSRGRVSRPTTPSSSRSTVNSAQNA
jgi:hypothetical protein